MLPPPLKETRTNYYTFDKTITLFISPSVSLLRRIILVFKKDKLFSDWIMPLRTNVCAYKHAKI